MIAAVILLSSAQIAAQVFSPGPLSSAHKQLDGLTSCTKCHEEGGKHSNPKCLACHKEIASRIDQGVGYHARNKNELCAECHKEHKGGTGDSLIHWSMRSFNHALTGWPLHGAHQKNDCRDCHEARRILDGAVKKLLTEKKRTRTFLGLSSACTKCHFDEHRGQEGNECTRCHGNDDWKPTRFVHKPPLADFRLKGRHNSVACAKCHEDATDESTRMDAFPKPRARTYMQMQLKGIGQNSCLACHDDVHHGEFGKNCVKCHSESGWKVIKQTAHDTGFHDKTKFPLRGEHTSVACKSCHGPFPGQRAVFKGLKHETCGACHADAHEGQVKADCEKCHSVTGFTPVLFDVKMHDDTRFALAGSHRAVACNLCHKSDRGLLRKVPSSVRRELSRHGRPLLVSDVKLALPDATGKCEACHRDPHGGQFSGDKGKACDQCHQASSFDKIVFNHDDSRFPLTGKHKAVECGACHYPAADAKGHMRGIVMYKPVDTACASCHADQHVGQLAKDGVTACEQCHSTKGFKPAKFDHDKQSSFPLEGKHKTARCAACHEVIDTGTLKTARYKPLPTACASCHQDEHKGGFNDFAPAPGPSRAPAPAEAAATTKAPAPKDAKAAPPVHGATTTTAATETATTTVAGPEDALAHLALDATGKNAVGCDACHAPKGWSPARFAHDRTPFPLVGKHRGVGCVDCHGGDTSRPIPTSCAGCHQDPHAQEFGLMCRSCHTEDGFNAPNFTVDAHRRTNFPLVGRHAALPCEECHIEKRERTFSRAALACVACHAKDAARASLVTVDHARAPFTADCRTCHQPVAFTPAAFLQHEACFPILRGVHAPVSCNECHSGLRGAASTGSCAGVPVRCAECHAHNADIEAKNHKDVQGYEHKSEKCAQCHRSP